MVPGPARDNPANVQLDLGEIYGARLELLRPTEGAVARLRSAYKEHVVPEALEVISALREIGISVYVVSGGLVEPVTKFAVHLGIDANNVRGVQARFDGLSGGWWRAGEPDTKDFAGFKQGALTRTDGKPEVTRELLAGSSGRSLLVGDGASDERAAPAVDLFVGFGGVARRARVAASAPVYISAPSLAPVLPIAAGPSGRDRLVSAAARQTFARGAELLAGEGVTFNSETRRAQLLAALSLDGAPS